MLSYGLGGRKGGVLAEPRQDSTHLTNAQTAVMGCVMTQLEDATTLFSE